MTELKKSDAALKAANEALRQVITSSPFGVYAVDADMRLLLVSDGAQRTFANVRPLIGRHIDEVLRVLWPEPFASEFVARFSHTLETGETYRAPSTIAHRADVDATEAYDWKLERIAMPDGRPGVICHFYDLTEQNREREHIHLLMREMDHRAKNLLTVVQAIARMTAAKTPTEFLERLDQRIQAIAASQELLVKSEWKKVSLESLVRAQLACFGDFGDRRCTIAGPPMDIVPAAAQTLGLAIHELATNAIKHGSLSVHRGSVEISWETQQPDFTGTARFKMAWIEKDGPTVEKPTRRGFGSTVIGGMVKSGLRCDANIDFASSGFTWRIACPAENVLGGSPLGFDPTAIDGKHTLSPMGLA